MKVLIRSPHHAAELAAAIRGHLDADPLIVDDAETCAREIADADILFCQPSQITPNIVEALGRSDTLRWLQVLGSGIDVLAGLDRGHRPALTITNAAEAYGSAVAEHAVTLALALLRQIPEIMNAKSEQRWIKSGLDALLDSLEGSRAVVIGFGAIGQAIAKRLDAFGAEITAVRRRQNEPPPEGFGHVRFVPLDEALENADLVFLALPLTGGTKRLLDANRLALLPRGARLVNVSRGEILDTQALINALETGALSGAALDVFATEPLEPSSALWTIPDLIISPHVAGRGNRLVTRRMIDLCERNLDTFLASPRAAVT